MKLFIWNSPYKVPYGGSFLFVAAETLEEAIKIAQRAPINSYGLGPSDKQVVGDIALGVPRIVELPYGECYEWSE